MRHISYWVMLVVIILFTSNLSAFTVRNNTNYPIVRVDFRLDARDSWTTAITSMDSSALPLLPGEQLGNPNAGDLGTGYLRFIDSQGNEYIKNNVHIRPNASIIISNSDNPRHSSHQRPHQSQSSTVPSWAHGSYKGLLPPSNWQEYARNYGDYGAEVIISVTIDGLYLEEGNNRAPRRFLGAKGVYRYIGETDGYLFFRSSGSRYETIRITRDGNDATFHHSGYERNTFRKLMKY